jgi:hypothetical protein
MTDLDAILTELRTLQAMVAKLGSQQSPWISGDKAAAQYAGFKSPRAFRAWAAENNIRPDITNKTNFWSRADIAKAREGL